MAAHSFKHEPWAPTLRPPLCLLAMEPTEDTSSGCSFQQGSKPSQAPRRTLRDDDSWLNFPCEERRQSYQSFYPPFPVQQHRVSSCTEDSWNSKEDDATPRIQGGPFRARRASWMVDHGEWRPTLSPISCAIPEDERPQKQSKDARLQQQERPQRTTTVAVQPKTAGALRAALQQRRGVVPATKVAVAVKPIHTRSLLIPMGGNDLEQNSDNSVAASAPEQFDLTLNDTDDDEQDFFPADPGSAGLAAPGDAASSPAADGESGCPTVAAQKAVAMLSPTHVNACSVEKPEAAGSRRTRVRRQEPRLPGSKGGHIEAPIRP